MDGIIGRIQTEADSKNKRTDIQLETNIHAIKTDGDSIETIVENLGLSASIGNTQPAHSSLWIIPD